MEEIQHHCTYTWENRINDLLAYYVHVKEGDSLDYQKRGGGTDLLGWWSESADQNYNVPEVDDENRYKLLKERDKHTEHHNIVFLFERPLVQISVRWSFRGFLTTSCKRK